MRPAQLLVGLGERHMDYLSSKTRGPDHSGGASRRRPSHEDHDTHDRVFRPGGDASRDVDPGRSSPLRELNPLNRTLTGKNKKMTTLTFIIQLSALAMTSVIGFMVMTIG